LAALTLTYSHHCFQQYHGCTTNTNTTGWHAKNNTLYGPNVALPCGRNSPISLAEWQAKDPQQNDVGSKVVSKIPTGTEIIVLARTLLD
jgi:hypothetical protein